MDAALGSGEVFLLAGAAFLLFVFPAIFTLGLNFVTRRLFGIANIFRFLDLRLHNLLFPRDHRDGVTEDVMHFFGLLVFISAIVFIFILLLQAKANGKQSSVHLSDLLALGFTSVAFGLLLDVFVNVFDKAILPKLGEKSLSKYDPGLAAKLKQYGFQETAGFGLKRNYSNDDFYAGGSGLEVVSRHPYRSKKTFYLKVKSQSNIEYYIPLDDKDELAKVIGPDNAGYVLANQDYIFDLLMSDGWLVLTMDCDSVERIDEAIKFLAAVKKYLGEHQPRE